MRPETDADLHALVAILVAARDLYLGSGATRPPSLSEVASQANATPEQVIRLLNLALSTSHVGVSLQKRDGEFQLNVDEAIFEIDKVKTLDDFLEWLTQKEQERNQRRSEPSPPSQEVMPLALSGQQLALHRSFAAQDEKLAAMYEGALLVLGDERNRIAWRSQPMVCGS